MSKQNNNCENVEVTLNNFTYDENIANHANEVGVDPDLIKAIINTESHFDSEEEGDDEEQGLMQVSEGAAKDVWKDKEEFKEKWEKVKNKDIDANIECGTKYLKILLNKYDNHVAKALAAYNWGQGNLDKWLAAHDNNFEGNRDELNGMVKDYLHKTDCAREDYDKNEDSKAFGECHWVTIGGNHVCIKNK